MLAQKPTVPDAPLLPTQSRGGLRTAELPESARSGRWALPSPRLLPPFLISGDLGSGLVWVVPQSSSSTPLGTGLRERARIRLSWSSWGACDET